MTAPRPAPDLIQIRKNALIYRLEMARAAIARIHDEHERIVELLVQARTDLAVARETIELQRAALDAVRAALPVEESE